MDTVNYRKQIEQEVLQIIVQKLKSGQMDELRARDIAQYILDSLSPHLDINQIRAVVDKFDDYFPELMPVVTKVSGDYDNRVKELVIKYVDDLIKQSKYNEATTLIRKAIDKKLVIK